MLVGLGSYVTRTKEQLVKEKELRAELRILMEEKISKERAVREAELAKERALRISEVSKAQEMAKSAMLEQLFSVAFHGDFELLRTKLAAAQAKVEKEDK
jgi:cell division protein FtsX